VKIQDLRHMMILGYLLRCYQYFIHNRFQKNKTNLLCQYRHLFSLV
jgi:hypothetical protein